MTDSFYTIVWAELSGQASVRAKPIDFEALRAILARPADEVV
jgi:hypothetical protein